MPDVFIADGVRIIGQREHILRKQLSYCVCKQLHTVLYLLAYDDDFNDTNGRKGNFVPKGHTTDTEGSGRCLQANRKQNKTHGIACFAFVMSNTTAYRATKQMKLCVKLCKFYKTQDPEQSAARTL